MCQWLTFPACLGASLTQILPHQRTTAWVVSSVNFTECNCNEHIPTMIRRHSFFGSDAACCVFNPNPASLGDNSLGGVQETQPSQDNSYNTNSFAVKTYLSDWTSSQLHKVLNRMGICLRGPKSHAKFMVAVWGIKICALKAPVQWRWSYTILYFAPKDNSPFFIVLSFFTYFHTAPTKSRCFRQFFCHQKWISHHRGWVWVIHGLYAAMVYMQLWFACTL